VLCYARLLSLACCRSAATSARVLDEDAEQRDLVAIGAAAGARL
jgi:hypothetical protein